MMNEQDIPAGLRDICKAKEMVAQEGWPNWETALLSLAIDHLTDVRLKINSYLMECVQSPLYRVGASFEVIAPELPRYVITENPTQIDWTFLAHHYIARIHWTPAEREERRTTE